MVVGHHLAETIDVIPDMLVAGVEDVRPVDMHHDTVVTSFGMCVSRNMRAAVDHPCGDACFC